MDIKLQNKLFKKYPKIFSQRKLPMSQTCMCWGITCDNGWYMLIDKLCEFLQFHTDKNDHKQVIATQVKEKFGGLRFYNIGGDKYLSGAIDFAEVLSNEICEGCGSTEGISQTKGWITTLCRDCMANTKTR